MVSKLPNSRNSGDSNPVRTYWLTAGAAAIIVAIISVVVALKPWPITGVAVPESGAPEAEPKIDPTFQRRIENVFPAGYMTALAIIQGVALGLLLSNTQAQWLHHPRGCIML
jgi:hypothetical protein